MPPCRGSRLRRPLWLGPLLLLHALPCLAAARPPRARATVHSLSPPRPPTPTRVRFLWPLVPLAISSPFGFRQDPLRHGGNQLHRGVDLQAPYGALVRSIAAGEVVRAGWHRGQGRSICLQHLGGYLSCYAHLAQLLVAPGAHLRAGAPLGRVGSSGRSTGPHLHLELQLEQIWLDPLAFLGTEAELVGAAAEAGF